MQDSRTELERAFDLARTGDYDTVTALRRQLKCEGYSCNHIIGASLEKQLKALMEGSRKTVV